MTRRFATTFALLITLTALVAASVAAKEMAVGVRLETAIPPDLKPGDTIDVAFTMTVTTPDGEGPYDADPMSVAVLGQSDPVVQFFAVRDRPGHYLATITVPPSGIGRIYASLPSDGPAPLSWELFAAPPVVQTAAAPTAPEASTAPVSDSLAWLIALGVAVAVIGAAAAVIVGRRRNGIGETSPTRA